LGLRSVVYLCADAYPADTAAHFAATGVQVRAFPLEGNREPFCSIDDQQLQEALLFALDARNQPVLVHCSKGKHRTGVFVGVLRRLAGQSLASTFAEYRQYIGASFLARDLDRLAIETHDVEQLKQKLRERLPEEHRPNNTFELEEGERATTTC
jgi:tyrosine-protein phosphatase SIW14